MRFALSILTLALAMGVAHSWSFNIFRPRTDRKIETVLKSNGLTNWGDWGPWETCPEGQFVIGFTLKTATKGGPDYDNTALNGIKLVCGTKDKPSNQPKTISSTIAQWGHWSGGGNCQNGYAVGFNLRMLGYQNCGDDVSTTDMALYCTGSVPKINGNGLDWGQWINKETCPSGQALCAIQTQVEPYLGDQSPLSTKCFSIPTNPEDDTALNNVRMGCCKL